MAYGHVAELAYAYASEAYGAILGGSNPLVPTRENIVWNQFVLVAGLTSSESSWVEEAGSCE